MNTKTKPLERPPAIGKVADAAKYLRCSEPTVREMIRSGKLHAVRVGRSIRIPRESIEAVLARPGDGRSA